MEADTREGNISDFLKANQEFHFLIYGIPGDDILLTMVESLWLQAGPYLAAVLALGREVTFAPDHHHDLLLALQNADGAGASRALKSDIATTAKAYKRYLGKMPEQ